MPNAVKYVTSTPLNSLRKGNVAIGVNNVDMGPTSVTGWYNGIIPPVNNITIYKTSSSNIPLTFAPQSDDELYRFIISQGGTSSDTTSVGAALAWIATQSNLFAMDQSLPNIVTDGLVLALNAGEVSSYPTTGTTWYDLSGEGINGTLSGPTYNTVGALDFNGSSDYVEGNSSVPLGNPCTVIALINCNSGGSGEGVAFGPEANGSDNWLAVNGTTIRAYACESADTNNFSLQGGTIVCDGTRWCTIACTIDGSTLKVYLNGVEKNAETRTFTIGGWTGGFDVGKRGNHSLKYFNGSISNVLGYDKVLTPSEMLQNYYQAPIVTDGLVTALDFSNLVSYESGDSSGYSLTGSVGFDLFNTPTDTTAFGGGITCQETDEFIALDDKIATDYVSVECWWTRDSDGVGTSEDIVWNKESTWELRDDNGNISWALKADNKNWFWHDSTADIAVGETIHFVLTYDGNYVKSYKNGELVQTYTYPSGGVLEDQTSCYPKLNSRNCTRTTVQNPGNHTFYQFRIYDRALTSTEVAHNYSATSLKFI